MLVGCSAGFFLSLLSCFFVSLFSFSFSFFVFFSCAVGISVKSQTVALIGINCHVEHRVPIVYSGCPHAIFMTGCRIMLVKLLWPQIKPLPAPLQTSLPQTLPLPAPLQTLLLQTLPLLPAPLQTLLVCSRRNSKQKVGASQIKTTGWYGLLAAAISLAGHLISNTPRRVVSNV